MNETDAALIPVICPAFSAKAIKTDFGHDRAGCMCTVYLGGKKAYEYHDDGYGGGHEIIFTSESMNASVQKEIERLGIAGLMHENGWDFLAIEKIDADAALGAIAEALINKSIQDKTTKKIATLTKRALVWGRINRYQQVSWRNVADLKDLLKYKNGAQMLQKEYDEAKASLGEGDQIFNTPEQLASLGIKL